MADKHPITFEQRIILASVTIREAIKKGPGAFARPTPECCMIALAACDRRWLPHSLTESPAPRLWAELDEIQRGAVLKHFNGR